MPSYPSIWEQTSQGCVRDMALLVISGPTSQETELFQAPLRKMSFSKPLFLIPCVSPAPDLPLPVLPSPPSSSPKGTTLLRWGTPAPGSLQGVQNPSRLP